MYNPFKISIKTTQNRFENRERLITVEGLWSLYILRNGQYKNMYNGIFYMKLIKNISNFRDIIILI